MALAEHSSRLKGVALVLAAGVTWGMISLFVHGLGEAGISERSITALRSFFAAVILLAVMPLASPGAFRVRLRDLWCFAGCGLASMIMFNLLYFATLQRAGVGMSVILLYTSPVFVTALSCLFFGEKFGLCKLLALCLVTCGCVLVSGVFNDGGARVSLPVLLMGIGSGFCYALYSIFGRFAQRRGYGSDAITLWSFIFAGGAALLIFDWGESLPIIAGRPVLWVNTFLLVIVSTIIPYFCYTSGLKRLQPSTAAIAAAVEPVVGTMVGVLVFSEVLTWSSLSGMFLIFAAMFL